MAILEEPVLSLRVEMAELIMSMYFGWEGAALVEVFLTAVVAMVVRGEVLMVWWSEVD